MVSGGVEMLDTESEQDYWFTFQGFKKTNIKIRCSLHLGWYDIKPKIKFQYYVIPLHLEK